MAAVQAALLPFVNIWGNISIVIHNIILIFGMVCKSYTSLNMVNNDLSQIQDGHRSGHFYCQFSTFWAISPWLFMTSYSFLAWCFKSHTSLNTAKIDLSIIQDGHHLSRFIADFKHLGQYLLCYSCHRIHVLHGV